MTTQQKFTLVTGATGTVGRHVVALLRARGVPVRVLVRDPDTAGAVLGPGVELAVGDFGDPASLAAASVGVEQLYLACANHQLQVQWETAAIDAALAAGARRVVKLSALGAEIGSPVAFGDAHGRIAAHLRARGVPHVLLEPAFNMANLLAAADGVRQAGAIFLPGLGAKIAMIDPRDVAEVAAVVLTTDGHDGRRYALTGPAAVTFDHVAEALSAALGTPVGFVGVTDAQAHAQVVAAGAPEWYATNLVRVFGLLRGGSQAEAGDVVRVLTGRDARPVAEFLRDHAGAFGPVGGSR